MAKATATSNQTKPMKSFGQAVAPQSARPTAAAPTVAATAVRSASAKVTDDDIRLLAYFKWEADGRPEGHDLYFWLEAERELLHGV